MIAKKRPVLLMGAGNVGTGLLEILLKKSPPLLDIRLLCDSRAVYRRRDSNSLTRKNLQSLLRMKKSSRSEIGERDSSIEILEFSSPKQETGLLLDEIKRSDENWIVIDSTYSEASDGFEIASALLNVPSTSLVTANKTAWADRDLCVKLYSLARDSRCLLGLNCILGVWVDQMEYIPLFLRMLKADEMGLISKRDNSSLNLFFTRLNQGLSPSRAFFDVKKGGYLEPGAQNLVPEVRDQITKLYAASNLCSAITGYRSSDEVKDNIQLMLISKDSTQELTEWFLSGKKSRRYPALISSITVTPSEEEIKTKIEFTELERDNSLATNFPGKNAISLRKSNRMGEFIHAGYGGAVKTALKLMWEANRAAILTNNIRPRANFDPIQIFEALEQKEPDALVKRSSLTKKILL